VRQAGILEKEKFSPEDANAMIMQARVAAGWITEEEYASTLVEETADDDEAVAETTETVNPA